LLDLAKVVQAKVIQEYSSETNPLNIVAITDGAKVIRNNKAIFGVAIVVILDWYHLCKKLRQLMSMVAVNSRKAIHLKFYYLNSGKGKRRSPSSKLRTQLKSRKVAGTGWIPCASVGNNSLQPSSSGW